MAAPIRKIENDTELDRILNKEFTSPVRTGYVEAGVDKTCLPIYYQDYEERIRKFEVRDDDVYLFGIAKSGTTWCHELLWLLVNDLDYEGAKQHSMFRCPLLDAAILYDFKIMKVVEGLSEDPFTSIEQLKSPRCIKSHLHWSLLPEQIRNGSKQPKIIWIYRNPKDTCVSHYHQARSTAGYKGTFEEFSNLYLGGRVPYGPFWKYVLSFWEQRHRPNILPINYEDMRADLPATIVKVASFLEKNLTDDQLEKLVKHLSFESMKKNSALDSSTVIETLKDYDLTVVKSDHVRSGKVGGFMSLMTPEIVEMFDAWTKENLAGSDFSLTD